MNTNYEAIEHGWLVYSRDEKRIGTVGEINLQRGFLILQKGWLFPRDLYLPLDAVSSIGNSSIHLAYTSAELEQRRWELPPPLAHSTVHADRDEPTIAMPVMRHDAAANEMTMQVHEEELVPERRTVQLGRVGLQTDVVEEPAMVTVPLHHEEIHVERRLMDVLYDGNDAFKETEIEIPIMSERLWVGKRARVVEEVRVYKRSVVEEQQITDWVRKERVHVEEEHLHDQD